MNKFTIQKDVRVGYDSFKYRRHIKVFKYADEMHGFLNKQPDNKWAISIPPFQGKSGIYAFAGGQWHNVKSLDASVLAHI